MWGDLSQPEEVPFEGSLTPSGYAIILHSKLFLDCLLADVGYDGTGRLHRLCLLLLWASAKVGQLQPLTFCCGASSSHTHTWPVLSVGEEIGVLCHALIARAVVNSVISELSET
jgi:hypothetical protein